MHPVQVSIPQALAFRLARQHLSSPAPDALTAARALLGAQAQVYSAGVLQLRVRSATGFSEAAAEAALWRDRSLVKLWAQRSTLHLVPREDLGLLLAMRRLRVGNYHNWYESEGLSPAQVEALVAAVAETLALHGPHSRMDLSRRLVPTLGEWARPWLEHSWGGVIKLACALGHVCHGPAVEGEEREAKFVHLPGWAGDVEAAEPRAAMAEILRRYLAAYGPAAPADFRKFVGLYAEPVRDAFADLAAELLPVDLAGRPAFALARDEEALRTAEHAEGAIAVTPLFDPYLLAHNDTGQYLADRFRPAVYRTAGWISPVVLRQGRVVATWTHKRTPRGWEVEITPLERVYKKELPAITRKLRLLAGGEKVEVRLAG